MPPERVFEVLEKAWFLGPGLYKKGFSVPDSREVNSREYIAKMRLIAKDIKPSSSTIAPTKIEGTPKYPDQMSSVTRKAGSRTSR
jgi:hypothetical protein